MHKLSLFYRQISKSVALSNKFLAKDVKKVEHDQSQETLSTFLDKHENKQIDRPLAHRAAEFKYQLATSKKHFSPLDEKNTTLAKSTAKQVKSNDQPIKKIIVDLKKHLDANQVTNEYLNKVTKVYTPHMT